MKASLLPLALVLACGAPSTDACQEIDVPAQTRCLSLTTYQSKMRAAWMGQMVGVSYALPVEFLYRGRTVPDADVPIWSASNISRAFFEDDLLVEVSFIEALQQNGLTLTHGQLGAHFSKTKFSLWHANHAARERLRAGLLPSNKHEHSSDIDYQIEADFSGLISPGLPARVMALGDLFGGVICEGECIDGGKFIGCLYAEAFFEDDLRRLIEVALRCVSPGGVYEKAIRDVLQWHSESPSDWRQTWQKIEEKHNIKERAACRGTQIGKEGAGFNISASLNGAYVVTGLLYGDKDIARTMKITTQLGQDADCNASSALGVLFAVLGQERIPALYWPKIPSSWRFSGTERTLPEVLSMTESLTRDVVGLYGEIKKTKSGRDVFLFTPN